MGLGLLAATVASGPSPTLTSHRSPASTVLSPTDEYIPFKGVTDSIYFWVIIGDGGTPDRALTAGGYEMGVTIGEPAIQISTAGGGSHTGFFGFWWPDLLPVPLGVRETQGDQPAYRFYLGAPYPNPSRGPVRIPYGVGEEAEVSLVVYDMTGRQVATLVQGKRKPGNYVATWKSASGGVYIVHYQAGNFRAQVKVIRR